MTVLPQVHHWSTEGSDQQQQQKKDFYAAAIVARETVLMGGLGKNGNYPYDLEKTKWVAGPSLIHSMSFNSISTSIPSQHSLMSLASTTSSIQTPDSEMPTTPTSLFSSTSDQSMEYTSFPNLEKFTDECWTAIRVEEKKDVSIDIEMESYDEMLVGGVRFHYT
ncbi:12494_t:CDS:2 [Funneliformis mosseae]|uniref:12494_t:CDS:1 n=1 Tax=Funneliformis mosseae TaxID=27381 RepID=A0A9N9CHI1_FUNMO|nr:12494_t:CDS:2 [Funneliformis mosseae]